MKVEKRIIAAIILASITTNSIFASFPIKSDALNKYSYSTQASEDTQIGIVEKNVNLRTEPNKTTSTVVRLLQVGESVEVVGRVGNYYKIRYNQNEYGYAYYLNYIKIIDPAQEILQNGVVIKNVNLRSAPTKTNSIVIRLLRAGENIKISGKVGNYYKIKYDENKYGYAYYNNYLKILEDNTNNDNNEENNNIKATIGVVTGNVSVREEADFSSQKICTLYKDAKVEIVGNTGSFYKIKYRGSYAYASKSYISIKENEKLNKIAELEVINDTDCMELASENSNKLLSLKANTKVNVVEVLLDDNNNVNWYKIEADDQYAYIKQSDAKVTNTVKDVINDGSNIYYLNDDGSIFKGGYKVINGVPYYFDTTDRKSVV